VIEMPWLLVVLAAGAAVAALAPPALGDREAQRRELRRNRSLWASQHLRDYRFRLRVRCFCPSRGHAVIVTVRNGRAHGASGFQKQLDTVPEMFAMIRTALDDPRAGEVTVRYDRRRGFPRTASIDRIKNAIDDEVGWTADRFRALPGP
jgi:hypothetical protein